MSCSIFTDANTLSYTVLVILTGHVEMMLRLCCNVRKYSLLSVEGLLIEFSPQSPLYGRYICTEEPNDLNILAKQKNEN